MKKLILLSVCAWLIVACGTQKINCKDPSYFYLVAPADIASVSGDSAVVIRKFKNDGTFSKVLADTLVQIDTSTGDKVARISDVFSDFLFSDFEVQFVPSQTQYTVTNIHTNAKSRRIANRDHGNSTYGICYNDFRVVINGFPYTSSSAAAYIKVEN